MVRKLLLILLLCIPAAMAETYYIKPTGNDGATGLSLETAWLTLAKVSTSISPGDSVLFADGTYRGQLIVVGGEYGNHTYYGAVSGASASVYLYRSTALTSWTQIGSTNRYYASATGLDSLHDTDPACTDSEAGAIFQNDSVFIRASDSATLSAGRWWADDETVVVAAYDLGSGYDPSEYSFERGHAYGVYFDGDSYVTMENLTFKYADLANMRFGGECDSIFIYNCMFSCAGGWSGKNPSNIITNLITAQCKYWRIEDCTFEHVGSHYNYALDLAHGAWLTIYAVSKSHIKDCTFRGRYQKTGIWVKNDGIDTLFYDTIQGCTIECIDRPAIWFNRNARHIAIIGNLFKNCTSTSGTITVCYGDEAGNGDYDILSNTFYLCTWGIKYTTCGNAYPINFECAFRYNTIYATGNYTIEYADTAFAADSNLYHIEGDTTLTVDGSSRTLAVWRGTFFLDIRSWFVDSLVMDGNYQPTNWPRWTTPITLGDRIYYGPGWAWACLNRFRYHGIAVQGSVNQK